MCKKIVIPSILALVMSACSSNSDKPIVQPQTPETPKPQPPVVKPVENPTISQLPTQYQAEALKESLVIDGVTYPLAHGKTNSANEWVNHQSIGKTLGKTVSAHMFYNLNSNHIYFVNQGPALSDMPQQGNANYQGLALLYSYKDLADVHQQPIGAGMEAQVDFSKKDIEIQITPVNPYDKADSDYRKINAVGKIDGKNITAVHGSVTIRGEFFDKNAASIAGSIEKPGHYVGGFTAIRQP